MCGEYRAHDRCEERRENFGLKIWMLDLAVNGRRILKWMLNK